GGGGLEDGGGASGCGGGGAGGGGGGRGGGGPPPPQFFKLGAESGERMREPRAAWPRPRAAQDRLFQRRDRARVGAFGGAEPRERMLDEGKERDRRKPAERSVRRQPCKPPGGGVRERIAAGIVDRDLPAFQRRQHATRQGAIGCDQGRGLVRR